ncbi:superoxide dismutase family protein [Streptomyces sp. NPDC057620]|uniref:superoxide dismutase family protein n=1 Tax=Streptomyces sp. NPDC057620 TaxID=3346185 RepID=UPI0036833831
MTSGIDSTEGTEGTESTEGAEAAEGADRLGGIAGAVVRRTVLLLAGTLASVALTAFTAGTSDATVSADSASADSGPADSASADSDSAPGYRMRTDARFAPPGAFVPSAAVTYDGTGLVPPAAWIEVSQRSEERGRTTVALRVTGLKAGHAYGVHVHRDPCGAEPAAAGGHYQHRPSTDPAAANPENEVWLDFTADDRGEGGASVRHDWNFRRGEAASVVLHAEPGGAGARLACFTVPFGWAG